MTARVYSEPGACARLQAAGLRRLASCRSVLVSRRPLLARRALVLAGRAARKLGRSAPRSGDRTLPGSAHGTIRVPAGHASGRVRVIVALRLPPLAAAYGRELDAARRAPQAQRRARPRRAPTSPGSRQAQAAARRRAAARDPAGADHRALPGPARRLHARAPVPRAAQARRRSPRSAGLPEPRLPPRHEHEPVRDRRRHVLGDHRARRGQGVKIGVVDDGIDQANAFLNPAGFSYPAGFPKGQTAYTTQKVIVARAFPGPGSGKQGRLPLFAADSFHGTHVAGIAAGRRGHDRARRARPPAGDRPLGDRPARVDRQLPRLQRARRSPAATTRSRPQIVQAFESAVNDGMDVINFSGGGPEANPVERRADRGDRQRRRRGRRPRDLGRKRPRRVRPRLGRHAEQRARRDLRRGGLQPPRLRARALTVTRRRAREPPARSRSMRREAARPAWARATSSSPTSGRSSARTASRSTATLCALPASTRTTTRARRSRPARSGHDRARLARRLHLRLEGASASGGRARSA